MPEGSITPPNYPDPTLNNVGMLPVHHHTDDFSVQVERIASLVHSACECCEECLAGVECTCGHEAVVAEAEVVVEVVEELSEKVEGAEEGKDGSDEDESGKDESDDEPEEKVEDAPKPGPKKATKAKES